MVTPASRRPEEMYRTADRQLRLLLLGDGVDAPGLVKGEDFRGRVIADLRRMRDAFDRALSESEPLPAERVAPRSADLEEELRRIAARSRTQQWPDAVTPAEAAQALRVSVSSIYRAVRKGEIRATRVTGNKRGALRIPAKELERLLE
jgi:excisionase family DNA binding protein